MRSFKIINRTGLNLMVLFCVYHDSAELIVQPLIVDPTLAPGHGEAFPAEADGCGTDGDDDDEADEALENEEDENSQLYDHDMGPDGSFDVLVPEDLLIDWWQDTSSRKEFKRLIALTKVTSSIPTVPVKLMAMAYPGQAIPYLAICANRAEMN